MRKTESKTDSTRLEEVNHSSHTSHEQENGLSSTGPRAHTPTTPHLNSDDNDSDVKEITQPSSKISPTKASAENGDENSEMENEDTRLFNQSKKSYQIPLSEVERNDTLKNPDNLLNQTSRTDEQEEDETEHSTFSSITPTAKAEGKSKTLLTSVFTEPKPTVLVSEHLKSPSIGSAAPTIVSINGSKDGLDLGVVTKKQGIYSFML